MTSLIWHSVGQLVGRTNREVVELLLMRVAVHGRLGLRRLVLSEIWQVLHSFINRLIHLRKLHHFVSAENRVIKGLVFVELVQADGSSVNLRMSIPLN